MLEIFILSKLIDKTGFEFLLGVSSWFLAIALLVIPWCPVMFISKSFEVGYGMLTIAVLTLCSAEAKERISGDWHVTGSCFSGHCTWARHMWIAPNLLV